MRLDVLFRSCTKAASSSGIRRPLQVEKPQLVLNCLRTLIDSMNDHLRLSNGVVDPVTLTVFDDHSESASVEAMRALMTEKCEFESRFIALESAGNSASLKANYEFARLHCNDLIYFVEDDYLHERSAVREMLGAFEMLKKKTGQDVVIHPLDYPDRYRDPYPSLILAGEKRYWRSVVHTTGTFMISATTFNKYWPVYSKFSDYGTSPAVTEDSTINQIYREVPCFSPMPSLTIHWQRMDLLPPFIDYKSWWEKSGERAP